MTTCVGRKLRSMDLSGAAQEHAAAEAARHRAARELERDVAAALDACIAQLEQKDLANVPLVMPPRGDSVWRGEFPRFPGEYVWLISADHDAQPLPVDLLDSGKLRGHAEEVAHNARVASCQQAPARGHWQKNGHGFGKTFVNMSGMRHNYRRAGYALASSGALCAPVLARIDQIYANYSIDVTLLDMESIAFGDERIERVPYGQLRCLTARRAPSQQLHTPDLTMAARDAAVAELARCHSVEERAEREEALPSELQCRCSAAHFEYEKKKTAEHAIYQENLRIAISTKGGGFVSDPHGAANYIPRPHGDRFCPIARAKLHQEGRRRHSLERRHRERERLEDLCREIKGIGSGWRFKTLHPEGVTVSTLADYLESGLLQWRRQCRIHAAVACQSPSCPGFRYTVMPDASVISYIRSFVGDGARERQLRWKICQLQRTVQCDLAYLRKAKCVLCGAHSC